MSVSVWSSERETAIAYVGVNKYISREIAIEEIAAFHKEILKRI